LFDEENKKPGVKNLVAGALEGYFDKVELLYIPQKS
jgi:hypothetical protein